MHKSQVHILLMTGLSTFNKAENEYVTQSLQHGKS